jgi:hypothetical protein
VGTAAFKCYFWVSQPVIFINKNSVFSNGVDAWLLVEDGCLLGCCAV